MSKKIKKKSLLIDLGLQPVSNRFKKKKEDKSPKFSFKLGISKTTGLISLNKPFPVREVQPRFNWITVDEPEDHLDDLVDI